MEVRQLIITIIFYILSLVLAMILGITGKQRKKRSSNLLIGFHFALLVCYLLYIISVKTGMIDNSYQGFIFLIFFCSGIVSFGWILRIDYPILLKVYFGIFILSIGGFLIQPSSMLYFIGTGSFSKPPMQEWFIKDNLYLQEQSAMLKTRAKYPKYKVVRKTGSFNKSLARDLDFEGKLDSMKLISQNNDDKSLTILGYCTKITPLETYGDSTLLTFQLGYEPDEITVNRKQ